MSIMDAKLIMSDGQAVTSTANSTDIIKLANTNMGRGGGLYLHITVNTACTASGAATVTFALMTGATSGAVTTVVYTTPAIGKATLVKGYKVMVMELPAVSLDKFICVKYTVATGPLTAGKFDAWVDCDSGMAN